MSNYFDINKIDLNKKYNFKYITKQDKLDFIRKFSKITVSSICNEHGIDRSNLYRNITSERNVDIVYHEILNKIERLLREG